MDISHISNDVFLVNPLGQAGLKSNPYQPDQNIPPSHPIPQVPVIHDTWIWENSPCWLLGKSQPAIDVFPIRKRNFQGAKRYIEKGV